MASGGRRPGAGRKKGSANKATKKRKEIAEQALAQGKTPLEVMLEAMRFAYEQGGAIAAVPFAKEAAPYVHPKLSSIDATLDGTLGYQSAPQIPVEQRDSMESAARPPARSN